MTSDEGGFRIAYDLRLRPTGRHFRIAGELWSVYEDTHVDWGQSLIFESVKIGRRVRNYPAAWRELSDEQLYALSWTR